MWVQHMAWHGTHLSQPIKMSRYSYDVIHRMALMVWPKLSFSHRRTSHDTWHDTSGFYRSKSCTIYITNYFLYFLSLTFCDSAIVPSNYFITSFIFIFSISLYNDTQKNKIYIKDTYAYASHRTHFKYNFISHRTPYTPPYLSYDPYGGTVGPLKGLYPMMRSVIMLVRGMKAKWRAKKRNGEPELLIPSKLIVST